MSGSPNITMLDNNIAYIAVNIAYIIAVKVAGINDKDGAKVWLTALKTIQPRAVPFIKQSMKQTSTSVLTAYLYSRQYKYENAHEIAPDCCALGIPHAADATTSTYVTQIRTHARETHRSPAMLLPVAMRVF